MLYNIFVQCVIYLASNRNDIYLIWLLRRAKCGIPSTLCWKIPNISGALELFAF